MPNPIRFLGRGWGALRSWQRIAILALCVSAYVAWLAMRPVGTPSNKAAHDLAAGPDSLATVSSIPGTSGDTGGGLVLLFLALLLYFIPAAVANGRGHRNSAAIMALNILLGWTILGWIIALIWAFTQPQILAGPITAEAKSHGFCTACGKGVPTGSRFCPGCGGAVPAID